MQYYSRTTQRVASGSFPGSAFAPDGNLQLAMPVRPADERSPNRSERGGARSANGTAGQPGDIVVLMHPGRGRNADAERPRTSFLLLLLCDAGACVACLLELRWRQVYFSSSLATGLVGLALDAVGVVAARWALPLLLGFFSVATFVQFCILALLLQSLPMLVHVLLLPFVLRGALALRRSLVPQWFSHRGPTGS